MPETETAIHFDTYRPSCDGEVAFLPEFPVREIDVDIKKGIYWMVSDISPQDVIIFWFILREFPLISFQLHYVLNTIDKRLKGTYYLVWQSRNPEDRFSPILFQDIIDHVFIPEVLEMTGKPAPTDMDLADVSFS